MLKPVGGREVLTFGWAMPIQPAWRMTPDHFFVILNFAAWLALSGWLFHHVLLPKSGMRREVYL